VPTERQQILDRPSDALRGDDRLAGAPVDGAGPFRLLISILIPVSRTNIGALFLIEFVYMWNPYLWSLIVANSVATRRLQIGIKQLVATDSVIE
jgi:sn-glycerol 3-phosphate transport system permease protein